MARAPSDINELLNRYTVDPVSGCWLWGGSRSTRGYGIACIKGQFIKAHRLFYERLVKPIPTGAVICHRCDNPPCVNPEHLFAGSQRDNIMDCIAKGRARRRQQFGEKNCQAKLTDEKVNAIRYHEAGSQRTIAMKYGVTQTVISDIKRGLSWRHV